jgi:hypothetical protein
MTSQARLVTSICYMLLLQSHIGLMCYPAKRVRDGITLPKVIVKQLVQYIPHNTYLYLYKIDREPVCCQQSLFGVCSQCDAVAVMLLRCGRACATFAHLGTMKQVAACLTMLSMPSLSYTCTCNLTVTMSPCTLAVLSQEPTSPELHGIRTKCQQVVFRELAKHR